MPTVPDAEDYNQNDNPGTEETINPYKIVNYAQLDDNLTTVANAIRAKGGTAAQLSFPAGMAQAIADISSGDTVYYANGGSYIPYTKVMTFPYNGIPSFQNCSELEEVHATAKTGSINASQFRGCTKLKVVDLPNVVNAGGSFAFNGDSALEHLFFPNLNYTIGSGGWSNANTFGYCTGLKTVQLGSIGHPAYPTDTYNNVFAGCTQSDLTITIFVPDDAVLPIAKQPWGATNATIVYRSTTTGEVIPVA